MKIPLNQENHNFSLTRLWSSGTGLSPLKMFDITLRKFIYGILFFLFFCLSFGQLGRISIFNGSGAVYFHDFFLILYICISSAILFRNKKKRVEITQYIQPFYPLIIVALISFILVVWRFSFSQNIIALAYVFRLLLLIVFFTLFNFEKITIRKIIF